MNFAFKEKYQKLFVKPREEVGFARWFAGFLAAGGAAGATALTVNTWTCIHLTCTHSLFSSQNSRKDVDSFTSFHHSHHLHFLITELRFAFCLALLPYCARMVPLGDVPIGVYLHPACC
jgi:hypothetical protein